MDVKHDLMQYSMFQIDSVAEASDAFQRVYALVRDKVSEQTSPVKYAGIDELWDEWFNEPGQ